MFSWKLAGSIAGLFCAVMFWASCGDTYRPVANPIISPGGTPQPIHYAYALYTNPNGPGGIPADGTLQQIDVSGDSVTLQVATGRNPLFASFLGTSTSAVYIANQLDGSITEQGFFTVNPPSVITLPTGVTPVSLGGTQVTAIYIIDSAAPLECPNGALSVMTTGNVITNTICVGRNPVALAQLPNSGKIYVTNQADNTVSVVDPVSQQVVATVPVGTSPVWATSNLDGSYVFVVNQGSASVTAIHTVDNATTTLPVGNGPNRSIFDSRRNRLYVSNGADASVSVFDLSQAAPVALGTVALGASASNPTTLVPLANGSRVYVANTGTNNVSVIDASSLTLAATPGPNPIPLFPTGTSGSTTQPLWIESEPTSTKIYVTTPAPIGPPQAGNLNSAPGVTIIQTSTNTIANFIQAPQTDPTCQINNNVTPPTTCTYQTPLQILTYVHN